MQTFDDLEHTSRSLNACFSVRLKDYKKKGSNDGKITLVKPSYDIDMNLFLKKTLNHELVWSFAIQKF